MCDKEEKRDIIDLPPIPDKFTRIPDNILEHVEDLTW